MFKTIISTEDLALNMQNADWAIVDCRFDLKNPDWGFEQYQQSHISGAVYAHLDRDLSGPITPQSGRHPLPDVDEMTARLGRWGIANNTQVVVYDSQGGSYAARLWWLLHFYGHERAAVLDGSYQKWLQEGRPTTSGVETRPPAQFVPYPNWDMTASVEEIERIRLHPKYKLVDARAPERFRGEVEPIDTAAGHIPGAVNRFHGLNLSESGVFLPPDVLKKQFQDLLQDAPPERTIFYCGSGVTSAHHVLAMEIAGLSNSRLYPGSWSEWIRDRNRPIGK